MSRLVVLSDGRTPLPDEPSGHGPNGFPSLWRDRALAGRAPAQPAEAPSIVVGPPAERFALAALRAGLCDAAEIWTLAGAGAPYDGGVKSAAGAGLVRRRLRGQGASPSADALSCVDIHGVPELLLVLDPRVDETLLVRCRDSLRIYACGAETPPLVPTRIARHIDLFLAADERQAEALRGLHPRVPAAALSLETEFAATESFFPTGAPKDFDVICIAPAEDDARHDILFDAFAKLPPGLRGLCVFAEGALADLLRDQIERRRLDITCIGPPGVAPSVLNALMNRARIGVVCRERAGAPAALTEQMLAGLPVLANAEFGRGLRHIRPETGAVAAPARFHEGILDLLARAPTLAPREVAAARWGWRASTARLAELLEAARRRKSGG
jgi:hypothetical protein